MQTIKLLSRRKAAPTLFVLEFERPADYSFRAGQFARLGMELEPGAAPVIRGYSIASAPEAPTLEFFITAVKDGKLSPKITRTRTVRPAGRPRRRQPDAGPHSGRQHSVAPRHGIGPLAICLDASLGSLLGRLERCGAGAFCAPN